MKSRLQSLSKSYGIRLLIPLFVIVAAALLVQSYLSFQNTKTHFTRFVEADATRTASLILRATHDGMLLGRLDEVQATVVRLARAPDVHAIRVFDKRGRVMLSSNPAEIGRIVQSISADRPVVQDLQVIRKEEGCARSGCHANDKQNAVMGVLDVEMSLVPLEHALHSAKMRVIWTTLAMLIAITIATSMLLRRVIIEPITRLEVLHMEKMASLGKLSATVAHELNNPISGMLTYARLVERELVEQPIEPGIREEIDRYLHLVQQECTRCGQIVQNLLVFAKRGDSEMTELDIGEVIQRSLMLVHHHMEMSHVILNTDLAEERAYVTGDAGQLEQALVALLVNAVEAMPKGGTLSVRLSTTSEDVAIEVSDSGTGIAPDVLPQIFEPFFTTKHNESGAGLGLAVVYGIIHRHDGDIAVQSTVNIGTTFHIRLPRSIA